VAQKQMDFSLLFSEFPSLTFDGIALGAIYALISLGYTLVYGVLRLINFAHSEVFMIGTFAALMASSDIMGFSIEDEPLSGGKLIQELWPF
jgi:branched-chain amino acid transport system permease protein